MGLDQARLEEEFRSLLEQAGTSQVSTSAYDTSWLALLTDEPGLCERGLDWLRSHQLPDGAWGASEVTYAHDRFICTLAAMIALERRGADGNRLDAASAALRHYITRLPYDEAGATVGFEMIVPTLMTEAKRLGLIPEEDVILHDDVLRGMVVSRSMKLRALAGKKISRFVTPVFSVEMVGPDIDLLDVPNLQEANGSVAYSPAATAFYLLHVDPGNAAAVRYLHNFAVNDDGGVPYVGPIDVFEHAWSLWNLKLVGMENVQAETLASTTAHLDFLEKEWSPERGIPACAGLTLHDGDDSGVTFDVLTSYGRQPALSGLLHYEELDHFRCYNYEANPSISTNIHMLGALLAQGWDTSHPTVVKVVDFLWRSRTAKLLWFDKWHSSPYYPTAHAAISLTECHSRSEETRLREMAMDAMYWIEHTQQEDGAWGFYGRRTAEETAYALQALSLWKRSGHHVANGVLQRGAEWLEEHMDPPYPPLWIGKCLYSPNLVVQSAILGALLLARQVT